MMKLQAWCAALAGAAIGAGAWGQCQEGWSEAFTPAAMSGSGGHCVILDEVTGSKLVVPGLRRSGAEQPGLQVWDGSAWSTWPLPDDTPELPIRLGVLDAADSLRLVAAVGRSAQKDFDVYVFESGEWRSMGFPQDFYASTANCVIGGAAPGSGEIYVGGQFKQSGVGSTGVYCWDGADWVALDTDRYESTSVGDLDWFDDGSGMALYASTNGSIDGRDLGSVVKWNGDWWSQVGSGCPVEHPSMAVHDDGAGPALWALGRDLLARWDGTEWESFPIDADLSGSRLTSVKLNGTQELVWTQFNTLCRWDGIGGQAVTAVHGGSLVGIAPDTTGRFGGGLFAVGGFIRAGDTPASSVARWDGLAWQPVGTEQVGNGAPAPNSIATIGEEAGQNLGGKVYVGARQHAGGEPADGVVAWDGERWLPVGPFDMGHASVLAMTHADLGGGGRLFAAGNVRAGSGSDRAVVAWDGHSWSVVGDGADGTMHVITFGRIAGGEPSLFVGGDFRDIGGESFQYIAGLTDEGWTRLGEGVPASTGDPWVRALEVHDDGSGAALYVGCVWSSMLDGDLADCVIRWNGHAWERVGEPLKDWSSAIMTLCSADLGDGRRLYAGGRFQGPHGELNNVAAWDGSAWRPLGDGLPEGVQDLTRIETPDGARLAAIVSVWPGNEELIYLWDGVSWSGFGAASDGTGSAIVQASHEGGALYVVGDFTEVGGVPSEGIARWGCEACAADFNGDGAVDTRDFVAFLNSWAAGDEDADFDGNGVIDTRDFIAFLNTWNAGC